MSEDRLIYGMVTGLRDCWKSMIVTDLLYKLLAFIAITPMFAILFRGLLAIGGNEVLSDVDIAKFFAGPFGLLCAVLLGALWLAILALEQASLIAILAASKQGKRLNAFASLLFAARNAPTTLRVSSRIVFLSLLVIAPFLLFAVLIYYWILSEYDKDKTYLQFLTLPRVLACSFIGALSATLIGLIAINSLQLVDQVEIMAHRGASKVAPDNSLAAFQKAIDAGADWVEIDVQETADGEVVVVHDSDLMKVARNKIKIWEATMADLRAIDIGSSFDAQFSDERVPTLGEVLTLCRGKTASSSN